VGQQPFSGSIIYNSNDPYNSGQVATMIRLSQAGTQPNIGLLHSGVTPVAGATGLQANQMPNSINYSAGGAVVSEGPTGVSVPAVPLNNLPNAAATGPSPGAGNANQSLIAAMAWGDNVSDNAPYQQAPTLGAGIASNAAGVAGGEQTQITNGATQLDNVQFTAAPTGTITSLTLNAAWPRATATNYILALSNGQTIFGVTLTNGATTCTFPSTVIQGSPTVLAAVSQ
jgi:hypothetical protein